MKRRSFLSIHNLFYLLFILVLIFGTTTLFNNINTKDIPTGNAISGEWTSYTSAFSGSGTESDPYKIASAENLAYLALQVNSGTTYDEMYFKQTANIDLSAHYWVPIGTDETNCFSGKYNGGEHVIFNMTTKTVNISGLFGTIQGANISNLGIEDSVIIGMQRAGGLAGKATSEGRGNMIQNCYNSANVTVDGTFNDESVPIFAGGIIGSCDIINITNCYNSGTINAIHSGNVSYVGGMFGAAQGEIKNCYNNGMVYATSNDSVSLAGICASKTANGSLTIANCFNAGEIYAEKASHANIGGLGGAFSAHFYIYNSYNIGNLYSKINNTQIGGIVCGTSVKPTALLTRYISIIDCINIGTIQSTYSNGSAEGIYGGIIGSFSSSNELLGIPRTTIKGCINKSSLSSLSSINKGGIVGKAIRTDGFTISDCIYSDLDYGIGQWVEAGASNTGCTKDPNVSVNVEPRLEEWYTDSSNWYKDDLWDFENIWTMAPKFNDDFPVFQWRINQLEYIINLNANGGTLNIGAQIKVPYGSTYTMPSTSKVTRTGYTLTGWKAVIENSTYTYTPGQIITIPTWSASQTTVTFYAQWRANTYTVSFDNTNYIVYPASVNFHFNGISGIMSTRIENNESITSVTITSSTNNDAAQGFYIAMGKLTVGEKYTWSVDIKSTHSHLIRIGQEQGGTLTNYFSVTTSWQTLTWTYTTTEQPWTAFEFYRGSGNWVVGEVFEFKNLVLKKTSDTVTDQVVPTMSYTFDQYYTNLPTPTRYGYNFTGWYTSANGGSQVTSSTQVKTANNHTLYSRWTAKTDCVLTFNANGGTVSPASRNQTFTQVGTHQQVEEMR